MHQSNERKREREKKKLFFLVASSLAIYYLEIN